MSDALAPDPGAIGRALPPPFARVPDPATLFARRSDRLRALAAGHGLGPYLAFLAALAACQDAILGRLPPAEGPDAASVERCTGHGLPPLPRETFVPDEVAGATLDAFFDAASATAMPGPAAAALATLRRGGAESRRLAIADVMAGAIPVESLAGHAFVAAALQVHFARLASGLDARMLRPVAQGLCPACGAPPVSSLVVGWPGAENARYCACSLCATLWNAVRVRCTACGETKGIGFRSVEGSDGSVKAECCDNCGTYLKVLYQVRRPELDPVADDVATLDLDILLRESPYRRSGFNAFLIGA